MKTKTGKIYIYNYQQAYYYISRGAIPIAKPEVHNTTKRVYFTFNYDDVQELYHEWCNNIRN